MIVLDSSGIIFSSSPIKLMLWVLIRSTSSRCFWWVAWHLFWWRIKINHPRIIIKYSSLVSPNVAVPIVYCIYHMYSDRQTWAHSVDSVDPDWPASVAQLDAPSDWRPGGRGFNPCRGRQHSFVEIDHEIFSTVILSLLLIQEGQLSVSGERMCTILVNRLED